MRVFFHVDGEGRFKSCLVDSEQYLLRWFVRVGDRVSSSVKLNLEPSRPQKTLSLALNNSLDMTRRACLCFASKLIHDSW